jgi:hypothetical protein
MARARIMQERKHLLPPAKIAFKTSTTGADSSLYSCEFLALTPACKPQALA